MTMIMIFPCCCQAVVSTIVGIVVVVTTTTTTTTTTATTSTKTTTTTVLIIMLLLLLVFAALFKGTKAYVCSWGFGVWGRLGRSVLDSRMSSRNFIPAWLGLHRLCEGEMKVSGVRLVSVLVVWSFCPGRSVRDVPSLILRYPHSS